MMMELGNRAASITALSSAIMTGLEPSGLNAHLGRARPERYMPCFADEK